jgi:hypothetical protein
MSMLMACMRHLLGPLAAVWLLTQGALLAASPVALWVGVDSHAAECTCATGDHAICPLHHSPSRSDKLCLMRSAHDPGSAALASVFGFLGLAANAVEASVPLSEHAFVARFVTPAPSHFVPPDSPPPRL